MLLREESCWGCLGPWVVMDGEVGPAGRGNEQGTETSGRAGS